MKINAAWHRKYPLLKKASLSARIQWHADHSRECGCRPIPEPILKEMKLRKPKLVVGVLAQNGPKYLLVREKLEGDKEWWIVPGGKVEFGESLEEAARREILEETGIKTKKLEFLYFYEAIFPKFNYHTVIFFYRVRTTQTKLGKDIEGKVLEAKWFTKKELLKLNLVDSAEWLFKQKI
ncbi:MAG: NUDIX hydrolase [bacterium]|nr:NUDIX hydrolase [bacterium]